MLKSIVARLEAGALPIVDDGFIASDYAEEIGISDRTARDRLMKLAKDGVVRRVRVKRSSGVRQGWQIIAEKKGRSRG